MNWERTLPYQTDLCEVNTALINDKAWLLTVEYIFGCRYAVKGQNMSKVASSIHFVGELVRARSSKASTCRQPVVFSGAGRQGKHL
jgi:hypothetical protein